MWFLYALITTLAWGVADLFYKKGADEREKYSHLKTSMAVGFVMGLHAIGMLIFGDLHYDFRNILIYLPVSLMYMLSMTVGYFGLKYLELSISSPIQNASGAVVCILCLVILRQAMDTLSAVAVVLICIGVILLGVFERAREKEYELEHDRKYKIGFVAFFMPILYCVLDSLGTFFDAWYLDDVTATPLVNVTEETFEDVANVSYELLFLLTAIVLFVYVFIIKKEKLFRNLRELKGASVRSPAAARVGAAVFETAGQFTYVYAMSGNGVVAAPMWPPTASSACCCPAFC